MVQGDIIARETSNNGAQASWVACAQNAKGFAFSRKRPNASNEGTARILIKICSESPVADR